MRSLLLIAVVVLVGCTSARDRAVERASAALERGDLVAAAIAWQEACAHDAEDCPRAAHVREEAIAEAVLGATPACTDGETTRCVEALRHVRKLATDEPRVIALLEQAGELQLDACGDALDLQALRCAESYRDRLAVPGYDRALRERRVVIADAIAAQVSGDAGADVQRLGAAACLDGTLQRRSDAADAATAFDAAIALPLSISWRVNGVAQQLRCVDLLGNRPLRCATDGLLLEIAGDVEAAQHERHVSNELVRWEAGTRAIPNPSYGPAATRALLAEDAVRAIETDLTYAESECDAAERVHRDAGLCLDCRARTFRDLACDRERELERLKSDRESEARSARWDLERTPEFYEEPVQHTATLQQTDHTWLAPWHAVLRLGDEERVLSGTATHRDREHGGLQLASIARDPLEAPPPGFGAAHLATAVRSAATELVDAVLLARAREREQACPDITGTDEASLRCRAEVRRLSSLPANGAELLMALAGGPISCR